jgi:hypothetical protein
MRTPAALGVAVVVSALLAGQGVLAQPTAAERQASSRAHHGLGVLSPDPVFEAPFSAEALTVWRPPASSGLPEWRATARYYRDRAGRVRVEQQFVGRTDQQSQRVIIRPDPNSPPAYVLDPLARTVSRTVRGHALATVGGADSIVMALGMVRFIDFFQPARRPADRPAEHTEEPLGHRVIAGVGAVGTRLDISRPYGPTAIDVRITQERWVSPELQVMVYSRTEDSRSGILEYRLTHVDRTEPPAALFTVPADYAEVALPFPQKWENPYVLAQPAR